MDPGSALLLFALFLATEKVIGYAGGKVADAMSKPIWEALEEKAKWLSGQNETAKRWSAFGQAFSEAKTPFLDTAPNPSVAWQLVGIFEHPISIRRADRYLLEQLASEMEKASLLSEKPNEEAITNLCLAIFQRQGAALPSRADLADAIAHFVRNFQNRLFAQSAYTDWMLK